MFKLLILVALVLAVLYFFTWLGRQRPGDWRRGDDDDDGPVLPTGRIGLEGDAGQSREQGGRQSERAAADDDLEEAGTDRGRNT